MTPNKPIGTAKVERLEPCKTKFGLGMEAYGDGEFMRSADFPAYIHQPSPLVDELEALKKRLPLCPPCDIGENTECICEAKLVPESYLSPLVEENRRLKEALERAAKVSACLAGMHFEDGEVMSPIAQLSVACALNEEIQVALAQPETKGER